MFIRSLFGQGTQPNAFIVYGSAPIEIVEGVIMIKLGVIIHNKGENIAKNLNGYVFVGGKDMAIEVNKNTMEDFSYSTNNISGIKVGFTAKPHFILGVEQEVLPLTIHIKISKPVSTYGILIQTLINCDNQQSYRFEKKTEKEELEKIYDSYILNNKYNILEKIIGRSQDV